MTAIRYIHLSTETLASSPLHRSSTKKWCFSFTEYQAAAARRLRSSDGGASIWKSSPPSKYPVVHHTKCRCSCSRIPAVFSVLRASPPPANKFIGDDVLRDFLKERELTGDFIAKLCDELWLKGVKANFENFEEVVDDKNFSAPQLFDEEDEGGFLKLKRTSEWLLGDNESAPLNNKMSPKLLVLSIAMQTS